MILYVGPVVTVYFVAEFAYPDILPGVAPLVIFIAVVVVAGVPSVTSIVLKLLNILSTYNLLAASFDSAGFAKFVIFYELRETEPFGTVI